MIVDHDRLFVLPDNRAVWEYDGSGFSPITGYDVNQITVAGGHLFVLPDNQAVWQYDGNGFQQITDNDVLSIHSEEDRLYMLHTDGTLETYTVSVEVMSSVTDAEGIDEVFAEMMGLLGGFGLLPPAATA